MNKLYTFPLLFISSLVFGQESMHMDLGKYTPGYEEYIGLRRISDLIDNCSFCLDPVSARVTVDGQEVLDEHYIFDEKMPEFWVYETFEELMNLDEVHHNRQLMETYGKAFFDRQKFKQCIQRHDPYITAIRVVIKQNLENLQTFLEVLTEGDGEVSVRIIEKYGNKVAGEAWCWWYEGAMAAIDLERGTFVYALERDSCYAANCNRFMPAMHKDEANAFDESCKYDDAYSATVDQYGSDEYYARYLPKRNEYLENVALEAIQRKDQLLQFKEENRKLLLKIDSIGLHWEEMKPKFEDKRYAIAFRNGLELEVQHLNSHVRRLEEDVDEKKEVLHVLNVVIDKIKKEHKITDSVFAKLNREVQFLYTLSDSLSDQNEQILSENQKLLARSDRLEKKCWAENNCSDTEFEELVNTRKNYTANLLKIQENTKTIAQVNMKRTKAAERLREKSLLIEELLSGHLVKREEMLREIKGIEDEIEALFVYVKANQKQHDRIKEELSEVPADK